MYVVIHGRDMDKEVYELKGVTTTPIIKGGNTRKCL